ncbi:GntR family transcriptional regulator [Micromonospora sp. NPDC005806]|uniref:GntR family transcriptional regulator n=1 Tax=Micromonospora sp. NPDC005806 TaxID=3364234 RepID=UPI003692BCEA
MRPAPKLKRTSLVDQAVEQLRNEIIDGSLPPGTPLPEVQVSESLGIARPTVREVLLQLQNEGLVQRQGRGLALAVTRVTREQMVDIYTARLHLEMAGARSFATAAPADREELDRSLEALEAAVASSDRLTQVRLEDRCHTAAVGLTGSRRLVAAHRQLLMEARLAVITAGLADHEIVMANHHKFIDLLRSGQAEAACQQLEERLSAARERLMKNLPE